jgi:glycolate oxidase
MSLKREAYKALEDIVGPDYITEEPAVLDGYCFVWGNELFGYSDKFSPRPQAVILPGCAEEVQAVVRVCNRYRVKFRPHATGFDAAALTAPEGFVPMDLRRMNRILEIDEKNMYAVVEPYVSFSDLTYEAIKKGVRPYVIGGGCSCSVLASATSHCGFGTTNISAGYGGRTPLAVEWVTPTGEILRLGSLGSGGDWFTGDGPGPSLRGIMRGFMGANGALGVITKAAIKLAPWYGPPKMESKGGPPNYIMELPESLRVYTIIFPSREQLFEAMYLINEEGIAYACSRRGPFTMAAGMTASNKELWEVWQTGYFQEKCAHSLSFVMDASSPREMEFREKCLREILARTEGEIFPEEPRGQSARFVHAFIGQGAVKGTFRPTGAFMSSPTGEEALDAVRRMNELGYELKDRLAKGGKILDDGDPTWVTVLEEVGGHMELPYRYDPHDPDSVKVAVELMSLANKLLIESKLGVGLFDGLYNYRDVINEMAGPECLNYPVWMRKIKKAFDPNLVAESSWYTTLKE